MRPNITREQLDGYLDDALSDCETAQVEQALRESETLRRHLRALMQERDRGEHSLGAVWRRERLSCPTREQLGSYLLRVLDAELHEYIDFHLSTIGCPFCQANLADLRAQSQAAAAKVSKTRQHRILQSSQHLLGSD